MRDSNGHCTDALILRSGAAAFDIARGPTVIPFRPSVKEIAIVSYLYRPSVLLTIT